MHQLHRRGIEGRRRRSQDQKMAALRAGERIVAAAFEVEVADLCAPGRGDRRVSFARQVVMYLGHVTLGLRLTDVGRHFGRDRTTVGHACARIEDRRENDRIDRILSCLEAAIERWRRCFLDGAAM
jgi:chromosomal replication initiation ATPase DnaA